jgi:carboxymethylenebutenolidase
VTSTRTDRVTVDDGDFAAHLWMPDAGTGPGLVLIQEIFGVGVFVRGVAEKLAALGYVVAAPDLFWRFAPNFEATHDEAGLADAFEKLQQLDVPLAIGDSIRTLEHVAELDEVQGRPGVIGYCLGGTLAWGVAGQDDPAVCVSYYGSGIPDMLDLVEKVSCPTLFHFGDIDHYLPMEGVAALIEAISGRAGFTINIEHAGHAFENFDASLFYDAAAAEASWAKTVAFLGTHLPTAPAATAP